MFELLEVWNQGSTREIAMRVFAKCRTEKIDKLNMKIRWERDRALFQPSVETMTRYAQRSGRTEPVLLLPYTGEEGDIRYRT